MASGEHPCLDSPGTSGDVRAWSEDPLTARARAVWTAGDFCPIATSYARGAEDFVARLEIHPGESVLDVACGTGNVAIPAAKAGARVIGVDLAPYLVAQARLAARLADCDARFEVGNAEALDFGDGRFDTTVSMFGAMFAYRPERAAAELVRVTRRGGRIAMANWTPEGFVGKLWRAHTALVAPPAGLPNPLDWGSEVVVQAWFGRYVRDLACTRRTLALRFEYPPAAVTELFATCYGPTVTTLRGADPEGASRLRDRLTRLFHEHNQATDGTTTVACEYLDVRARIA